MQHKTPYFSTRLQTWDNLNKAGEKFFTQNRQKASEKNKSGEEVTKAVTWCRQNLHSMELLSRHFHPDDRRLLFRRRCSVICTHENLKESFESFNEGLPVDEQDIALVGLRRRSSRGQRRNLRRTSRGGRSACSGWSGAELRSWVRTQKRGRTQKLSASWSAGDKLITDSLFRREHKIQRVQYM